MKRFAKSVLGVTLLEIMLVLAIAAMIIVMSVRYYQSATTNQQANAILAQLQAIVAAADSVSQTTGTYTSATSATLKSIAGANSFNTPWGTAITVTPGTSTLTFGIATVPTGVCNLLTARLKANNHWTTTTCTAPVYSANAP